MTEEHNSQQLSWLEKKGISTEQWSTLRNSLFPGANPPSVAMYWDYCMARKLDPMKKPAHIVPMNVKNSQTGNFEWRDVIMPGIYEYRTTAARTGLYAGQDEPIFGELTEMTFGGTQKIKAPLYAKVTVYRLVGGEKCPFTGIAYFEETAATKKGGVLNAMWEKRKFGQLAKCAEADALRKAFPDELGGEMTIEEMEGKTIDSIDVPTSGQIFTDEQYSQFVGLVDGRNPLGMHVFLSMLDPEVTLAIRGKYKSGLKQGTKGKENERINEIKSKGQAIFDEMVANIESADSLDDGIVQEELDEVPEWIIDFVYESLSPGGKAKVDDYKDAA
ncbi:MAG: phage recombination protein Bet [Pseudomonadota bacterium]